MCSYEKLLHELPVGWGEHECNEKNCDQKLSIKINELIEVVNELSENQKGILEVTQILKENIDFLIQTPKKYDL